MKKRKEVKFPSRKFLLPSMALLIFLGLGAGVGIYFLLGTLTVVSTTDDMYNVVRTAVAILGVITVGGAAAIQFRKQNFAEASAELERDAKFAALLTRAIEHLGNESIAIRKGAIYELRRLAVDSEKDRESVVEILSGFVREGIEKLSSPEPPGNGEELPKPEADIFIAAEVLSFLYQGYGCRASLEGLQAEHVNLDRVELRGVKLSRAKFTGTSLNGAFLNEANLSRAYLGGAGLKSQGTNLIGANLIGANLRCTWLGNACFTVAILDGADLSEAHLHNTIFSGTTLKNVKFGRAHLHGNLLQGSCNFIAEQLMDAFIHENNELDDTLREELIKRGKLKPPDQPKAPTTSPIE